MSDAVWREVFILKSRLERAELDLEHLLSELTRAGLCARVLSTREGGDRKKSSSQSETLSLPFPEDS